MGVQQLPSNLSMEQTASYPGLQAVSSVAIQTLPTAGNSYARSKRLMDLLLVSASVPVVLPLIGIVGFIVRISSPGPVFFRHDRILRKGKTFKMLKFRTMCDQAHEALEAHLEQHPEDREEWLRTHKLKNDPRITKIGWFLRKTSLDELPQLWHVLTGEMSLVGPRPIVKEEVKKYGDNFVYYTAVKPGIAGLWQASGRSKLTYAERVALDRRYAEEWTLTLDIKILIRTLLAVLRTRGAF